MGSRRDEGAFVGHVAELGRFALFAELAGLESTWAGSLRFPPRLPQAMNVDRPTLVAENRGKDGAPTGWAHGLLS